MCDTDHQPSWLSDQQPHEEERSAAQIAALLRLLGPEPRRVLDLGCGTGRVLLPMVSAGHHVTGMDHSAEALDTCRRVLSETARPADLMHADFLGHWPGMGAPFDAVCLLGNTIMTVVDVHAAVELMQRICASLTNNGMFLIDDCPFDFWPELTEGNWMSGLSEDGTAQLVWDEADAVFALRCGNEIDTGVWRFQPADRLLRLWTMGSLGLAARLAGLSAPTRETNGALLVMRRGDR